MVTIKDLKKNWLYLAIGLVAGILLISSGILNAIGEQAIVGKGVPTKSILSLTCKSTTQYIIKYTDRRTTGILTCPANFNCASELGCIIKTKVPDNTQTMCPAFEQGKGYCINEKQFKRCDNFNNGYFYQVHTCLGDTLCWEGEIPSSGVGCVSPSYQCNGMYNINYRLGLKPVVTYRCY